MSIFFSLPVEIKWNRLKIIGQDDRRAVDSNDYSTGMERMDKVEGKGRVHLYTGDGKGKTTAALGLALRAAGAGMRTIIIQFMKGQHYSELDAAKMLQGLLIIEQYGNDDFYVQGSGSAEKHRLLAAGAVERAYRAIIDPACDILVLDEIITALSFGLVDSTVVIDLIKSKPDNKELVLTGRGAPESLYEYCDLVTEMKEIKHYYANGVSARRGIEC